jgi:hypothetical protein
MAEQGIDAFRVMSVLGYCLLPIVGVGGLSVVVILEYVCHFHALGIYSRNNLVGYLVIWSHFFLSYGPRTLLPAFSLQYLACLTSVYWLPTPWHSSTDVLHSLAYSAFTSLENRG